MPVSPSDVKYLNTLLDKHLKFQRSWSHLRWFQLAAGAFMIVMGVWSGSMAMSVAHPPDNSIPTTRHANATSTQPVTWEYLRMALEATRSTARMESYMDNMMTSISLVMGITAVFFILLGFNGLLYTLNRWNHHRRDTILITLLREKCAAELAPPAPP